MPSTYFLKLSKPVWISPTIVSNLSLMASQRTAHQLRRYSVKLNQSRERFIFMRTIATRIASRTVSNLVLMVSQRLRHFSARKAVNIDHSTDIVPLKIVQEARSMVTAAVKIALILCHIKSHIKRSDVTNADQSEEHTSELQSRLQLV